MTRKTVNPARCAIAVGLFLAVFAWDANAATVKVLHYFRGGEDGEQPHAGVIAKDGTLYGTTEQGGVNHGGTVFKLALDGTYAVLHSFSVFSASDGWQPDGPLVVDEAGNLYGTTQYGGYGFGYGYGTVFKLAADGTETILHAFRQESEQDGNYPLGGLTRDTGGNLYGTTSLGGANGWGTVYKITPDGTETVLYSFQRKDDGWHPSAGVIIDGDGYLYGTTQFGGGRGCRGNGCGTVFRIAPDGTFAVMEALGNYDEQPQAPLTMDSQQNIYGTTSGGYIEGHRVCGSVFKLSHGVETRIHVFTGLPDGCTPRGGVTLDQYGNIYGTTYEGGAGCPLVGCGTIFAFGQDGSLKLFYMMRRLVGEHPIGELIRDESGRLYGTASGGGHWRCVRPATDVLHPCHRYPTLPGVVFQLTP